MNDIQTLILQGRNEIGMRLRIFRTCPRSHGTVPLYTVSMLKALQDLPRYGAQVTEETIG